MMIIFLIFIFFGLCLWLGLRQLEYASLYFPDRQIYATPAQVGLAYEEVDLMTSDHVKIHGWLFNNRPEAPTLLFCHGNAGNISHRLDKVQRLLATGANVLLFDYRGYGQSQGRPSEKGTYRDAEAAYRYLTETRKISPQKIVLYGESLGGGVAVETVVHHAAAGLILESAFTSTIDMARRVFPWLPVKYIIRYRYDNLSKLPQVRVPVLFLHSRQDEIVPFSMAERNLAITQSPKTLVELIGGHNEGYADSGERYIQALKTFIGAL